MNLKRYKIVFMLFTLSILIIGCAKEEIPNIPSENSPLFSVSGSIGNENISIIAGENEAYMKTSTIELNNLTSNHGILSDANQSFSMLMFRSNHNVVSYSNNFAELSEYRIADDYGATNLLEISIIDFQNNDYIHSIQWTIDNHDQSGYDLIIEEPGKYNVCAEVEFTNGSIEKTCNSIIVGYERSVDFQLKWHSLSDNSVKSYIESSSNTVTAVEWYLNDSIVSDEIEYMYNGNYDHFHLKAKVTFQNGTEATREIYVNRTYEHLSIGDFANKEQATSLRWDNNVRFTFEKNGIAYESRHNLNNDSHFIVTEIEEYYGTTTTQQVKKIKGTLNIPFKNLMTGETIMSDLDIEIGVEY